MLSLTFCTKWILLGGLFSILVLGGDTNTIPTHYSNSSTPISTSSKTSTSTSHSSITSCASLVPKDFFAASLQSLPDSEFAALTSSEFAKVQELFRVYVRYYAGIAAGGSIDPAFLVYFTSLYSVIQQDVTSLLGPSGYANLNFQGITNGCLLSTCINQYISISSSFAVASPSDLFFYTARPPCCQQCTVYGQGVELAYWPTPAPTPYITALVDVAANFTFVSPTVYAFFTGLRAADNCGPVGGSYSLGFFEFGPTELSTSSILVNPSFSLTPQGLNHWTAINYADFGPQCTCTTDCQIDPIYNTTLTNLCTPQLSLPAKVTNADPAWRTCASNFGGVFDPPIALGLAQGLTTPKDTPAQPTPIGSDGGSQPSAGPTPAPANSPSSPIPNPTPTPQPETSNTPPAPVNPAPVSQSNSPQPLPAGTTPINPQLVNSPSANPPAANTAQPSLPSPAIPGVPAHITVANTILTPLPGSSTVYIVNTQTLVPGGSAVTVNGATISINPAGSVVNVPGPAPITVGNAVLTPLPGPLSIYTLNSQTLVPGGSAIIVNGATISLSPSGSVVIIPGPAATTPPALTIAGQVVTANFQSNYVIGSQTLIPGASAITVSGTPISLAPGATEVVVGGSTASLGSIILSVFNGGEETSTTAETSVKTGTSSEAGTTTGLTPAEFTGGAGRGYDAGKGMAVGLGFLLSALIWW